MRSSTFLSLAASLPSINAVFQGFNYGSTKSDGSTIRDQADFQSLFNAAKSLPGNSGFASARLYTTVQGGTANTPTSAIPAAIAENTSLLLGLWASGGQETITNEISALKTAIAQYGTSFTNLVAGISVGSEDLYRISPIGVAAKSGYGAEPDTIASYINQLRSALAGTSLSSAPIGHVDTWTAWVNGSNKAVIDACDWIGNDAYPYFQNTQSNGIENGASLFYKAMTDTKNAVGGKPVWITETGWPVSGRTSGFAETGISNAKRYWDEVGCPNFGLVNTWWFTLEDTDNNASPDPSFSIAGANPIGSAPLFDLSCTNVANTPSSVSSILASASALTGPPASSGSALAPSVDNGVGSFNPTMASAATASGPGLAPSGGSMGNLNRTLTGSGPYPTGSAGIPGSNNGTVPTVTTGSPGTKSSTVTSATQNAGAGFSRPVFGAVGALMVAVALG